MSGAGVVLTDGNQKEALLTEENLAALEDLDGDIATLVKKAVEEFLARAGRADRTL